MVTEVKYQMATKNGYDCEIIETAEDAAAFYNTACERATSPVWIWVNGRELRSIPQEKHAKMRDMFYTIAKINPKVRA